MPHATDEDDDNAINRLLDPANPIEDLPFLGRDLEPGDKADDAVDYEDFDDDDLPDDDDVNKSKGLPVIQSIQSDAKDALTYSKELPALADHNNMEHDGMDDLFGDNPSSPGYDDGSRGLGDPDSVFDLENVRGVAQSVSGPATKSEAHGDARGQSYPQDTPQSKDHKIQMKLFSMSTNMALNSGQESPPAPPENQEELLASLWPKFRRNAIPKFNDLLPPKKARYLGKTIPKPPKPVYPTKLNLELAQDQEKSFRIWPVPTKRGREDIENMNIVVTEQTVYDDSTDDDYVHLHSDQDIDSAGGVSWEGLQIICEDWDVHSLHESVDSRNDDHHNQGLGKNRSHVDKHDGEHDEDEYPAAKVSRETLLDISTLTPSSEA